MPYIKTIVTGALIGAAAFPGFAGAAPADEAQKTIWKYKAQALVDKDTFQSLRGPYENPTYWGSHLTIDYCGVYAAADKRHREKGGLGRVIFCTADQLMPSGPRRKVHLAFTHSSSGGALLRGARESAWGVHTLSLKGSRRARAVLPYAANQLKSIMTEQGWIISKVKCNHRLRNAFKVCTFSDRHGARFVSLVGVSTGGFTAGEVFPVRDSLKRIS